MKNTFLFPNNVISILDLFKILTYYIDDKKILEISTGATRGAAGRVPSPYSTWEGGGAPLLQKEKKDWWISLSQEPGIIKP